MNFRLGPSLVLATAPLLAAFGVACSSTTAMDDMVAPLVDAGTDASDATTADAKADATDDASPDDAASDAATDARAAVDGGPCAFTATSTLSNVHFVLRSSTCTFTLAQAKAGITIAYDLVVDAPVPGFVPATPYPYGPNAANLDLGESLAGGGQSYCVCEEPFPPYPSCPSEDGGVYHPMNNGSSGACSAVTIPQGTYPRAFTWDGRNWNGPSDVPIPEGALFPAGTYTLTLTTAAGSIGDAGSLQARATLPITLIP